MRDELQEAVFNSYALKRYCEVLGQKTQHKINLYGYADVELVRNKQGELMEVNVL